jgi:DNA-binding transcriptional LysR family regulator
VKLATKAGFQPLIIQQAQQINGLLALVAAGLGLALVPASMRAVRLAGVSYVALEDSDAYLLLAVACRIDDDSPALRSSCRPSLKQAPSRLVISLQAVTLAA